MNVEYLSLSQLSVPNFMAPVLTMPRIYQDTRLLWIDGNTNPPPESPENYVSINKINENVSDTAKERKLPSQTPIFEFK